MSGEYACPSCISASVFESPIPRRKDLPTNPESFDLCRDCSDLLEARFPQAIGVHPDKTLAGLILEWFWFLGGINFGGPPIDYAENREFLQPQWDEVTAALKNIGRPVAFPIQEQGFSILVESLCVDGYVVAYIHSDGEARADVATQVEVFARPHAANAFAFLPDGEPFSGQFCTSIEYLNRPHPAQLPR